MKPNLTATLLVALLLCGCSARSKKSYHQSNCLSSLSNYRMALDLYRTDWGGKLPSQLESLSPNYMKTVDMSCHFDPDRNGSYVYYDPASPREEVTAGHLVLMHCRASHPEGQKSFPEGKSVPPLHRVLTTDLEFEDVPVSKIEVRTPQVSEEG